MQNNAKEYNTFPKPLSKMKTCIICIGSNHNPSSNITKAVETLSTLFPGILWGETVVTPAEGVSVPVPDYHNRAAVFTTCMGISELKRRFKEIEKACGRGSDSKSTGIVPLDIDLLQYDGEILKPRDMQMGYVRKALKDIILPNND